LVLTWSKKIWAELQICYHGQPRNPPGCPRSLKVEPSGDTIQIETFSGKVQTGGELAFHRSKVHFFQAYSTTGYELFLVAGVYFFFLSSANQFLNTAAA
jgi:hypothetical protein